MPADARAVIKRLRRGDLLVRNLVSGTWSLLRGQVDVAPDLVQRLQADRKLRLRPTGDCLPGFPAAMSQTWGVPGRKRRPVPVPPAVPSHAGAP